MNIPDRKTAVRASKSDRICILWRLAPFGAFGAILPAVTSLTFRSDGFAFTPELKIIFAQVIYILSAALLSAIFPYGREATPFRAALVGMGFPTIIGTALSATKTIFPAVVQTRGDESHLGSIVSWVVNTFALF